MGDFSRDTFKLNKMKNYVGVRLQQGVPILDADWNEMEDIRKSELQSFIKNFIGDGIPNGNNGFAITDVGTDENGVENFIIEKGGQDGPGSCLVNGLEVLIDEIYTYTGQPLYQDLNLPALTNPGGQRTDTVYLDVWEEEVNEDGDQDLVNPDIGIETCVRLKRQWAVRVAEDANEAPAAEPGHAHYTLAEINRQGGMNTVTGLRRTGLTILSEPITIKDGKVGIGTSSPGDKLDVHGDLRVNGRTNFHGELVVEGETTIIGDLDVTGNEADVLVDGSVGIGTATPQAKLDVNGDIKIGKGNKIFSDGGLNIAGKEGVTIKNDQGGNGNFIVEGNTTVKGNLTVDGTIDFKEKTEVKGDAEYDGDLVVKGNSTFEGNVGIGTTEPKAKLDVVGNIKTKTIDFATDAGQKIILYNKDYGIGIQNYTQYFRTGKNFAWYKGGGHSDNELDPGTDGTAVMVINDGSVGIGTSDPQAKLDVNGCIQGKSFFNVPTEFKVRGDFNNFYAVIFENTNWLNGPATFEISRSDVHKDGIPGSENYFRGTMYLKVTWQSEFTGNCGLNFIDYRYEKYLNHFVRGIYIIDQGPFLLVYLRGDTTYNFRNFTNGFKMPKIMGEDNKPCAFKPGYTAYDCTYISARDSTHGLREGKTIDGDLSVKGDAYASNHKQSGIDYAEYFESKNGEEIKPGTSVVLDEGMIRPAKKGENPIGIISASPGMVGGVHLEWPQKYLKNDFGVPIMEEYKEEILVPDQKDPKKMIGSGKFETKTRPKLNPDYDEKKVYVSRERRPEWNCVGLLGQLPLRKGQPVADSWVKIKDISDKTELWLVK
jgi:cytoskeletal protein CcmA (bactofilin family)